MVNTFRLTTKLYYNRAYLLDVQYLNTILRVENLLTIDVNTFSFEVNLPCN